MTAQVTGVGFHYRLDALQKAQLANVFHKDTELTYTFDNFFHPYVGELIEKLNRDSLTGLLDPEFHKSLTRDFFADYYTALTSPTVKVTSFPKEIDVSDDGPYANYNWELLFHIPLTIAVHLSKNQRFAEAQRWFHYVFDPTADVTHGLSATYFDNKDLTGPSIVRIDSTLDFNWGTESPDPSKGPDTFSARWTGKVQPEHTETYTFYTRTDDGVRLWVNGQKLIDKWVDQSATEHSGTINLEAGKLYDIKMEYYENGGLAVSQLMWSSRSTPKAIIPHSRLYAEAVPYAPARFWKFLRFRRDTDVQQIDDLLTLLSTPDNELEPDDPKRKLKATVLEGYDSIKNKPFQPHAVARTRTVAYQYCVVMKYLDNLIAWGDSLFMQDTVESINEAMQLYVLAANLLGPRPQQLPQRGTVRPKTFKQLHGPRLDAMGNALVELEGQFPFNFALPSTQNGGGKDQSGPLFGIGRTLYFCIPRNDRLLTYWDTVADRLFKIRNCMNIEGVVRQLALFDPPLDPGMLVKAAAAGIDIGSAVSGLNQPVGPVRCLLLIQKALELCGEVRGLGGALLSAIEKGDSEHLALLRQGHEIKIHQMSQEVRFLQWKQAQEATESLLKSRASALERYRYYQRLLGLTPDSNLTPDTFPLDRLELTEENFDEAYSALVGQYDKAVAVQAYPQLALAGGTAPANQSGVSGPGKLHLNTNENADLNVHSPNAKNNQLTAFGLKQAAPVLGLIPQFPIHIQFWGIGGEIQFGGEQLSRAALIGGDIFDLLAGMENHSAGSASKTGSFERRADEWTLQCNLAARELMQIGRQIISSLIAEQIAHHEYLNIQTQVSQAQEVDGFLRAKFTSEELYAWMRGEISRLYYEYYRFAFDTARKAERAMKQELMRPELDDTDYVKFNYWDGGRKGLLSGEALYLDVKRMEMAYHENNKREFELTRHISLRQLDPLALLTLKTTGRCEISIPESLYDRDCPGHYMRRLKNVSLSLPSVVGPYTSVNCTLTLLRSSVRKSPLLKDGEYRRAPADDDRFLDYVGSAQSVVTSGATNDSGLFETNLRDERFLPFEGAGAVGAWRLELPKNYRPFDYAALSDVILHVRYTARQGGELLGNQALTEMREVLTTANESGLALLFSLRHDFATEWSAFANGAGNFAVQLRKDYFPYMVQSESLAIDALELYAPDATSKVAVTQDPAELEKLANDLNGLDHASDLSIPPDAEVLKRDAAQVFLIVRYSLANK